MSDEQNMVEEVEADWLSEFFERDSIRESPVRLKRLSHGGKRYYYIRYPHFQIFPSVTTITSNTLPTSEYLIKWRVNLGEERADNKLAERAAYGTCLHYGLSQLLINRSFDLDQEALELVSQHSMNCTVSHNRNVWLDDFKSDILAISQFVIDKEVKPLAIELPVCSYEGGYAGCIDLICTLKFNRKTVLAIADLKSNRSGTFYRSHEVQLELYKRALTELMPELIEEYGEPMLFNFSPSNWRKVPKYHLYNQTGKVTSESIEALLVMYNAEHGKISGRAKQCCGTIDLDNPITIDESYGFKTVEELIEEEEA